MNTTHKRVYGFLLIIAPLLLIIPVLAIHAATQDESAEQVRTQIHLPLLLNTGRLIHPVGEVQPSGGICPAGSHLTNANGSSNIEDPDSVIYSDADYVCLENQSLDDVRCSAFGTAKLVGGQAICACQAGYVGASCDACAPGYQFDVASNQCVVETVGRLLSVTMPLDVVFQGATVPLRASGGSGSYRWEIGEGDPGCLKADAADSCQQIIERAPTVLFEAPSNSNALAISDVIVTDNDGSGLQSNLDIAYVNPSEIPVTGSGHFRLKPIVSAVSDYMHYRCVGAGVVGVSYYGKIIGIWGLGRMDGRAKLDNLSTCGDDTADPYNPASTNVSPNTPFRIGSVSKSVGISIARAVIRQEWQQTFGELPTDDQLENIAFIGSILDLPDPLMDVYAGNQPVPIAVNVENNVADPRWHDVTLGQIFSHRSGLTRSTETFTNATLPAVRGLDPAVKANFQSQDGLLVNQYGAAVIDPARDAVANHHGGAAQDVFFLPGMTIEETLLHSAGRQLLTDPSSNTYSYSNLGPAFAANIAEELGGAPFAATIGDPASHEGSLLDQFFDGVVGVPTTGQSGIFQAQVTWPPQPGDPEPSKRNWDGSQNTYYPLVEDKKRPHCLWNGTHCDFTTWTSEERVNWNWQLGPVPTGYHSTGTSPASGSLTADARTFLTYMSQFWVGNYDENPRIGESRTDENENTNWNTYTTHNGAWSGSLTHAIQLGTDSPTGWSLPPKSADGRHVVSGVSSRQPNFIVSSTESGQIVTYGPDGYSKSAFFHDAAPITLGYYDQSGIKHIYLTNQWGELTVLKPDGTEVDQWALNIQPDDILMVSDINDGDIFDEIVVIRSDQSMIQLYDHDGTLLTEHVFSTFRLFDAAIGHRTNMRAKELFTIGQNHSAKGKGLVKIYHLDTLEEHSSFALDDYLEIDGFAVGNVIGKHNSWDEVVIAHADTGIIDIYAYGHDPNTDKFRYQLYTSFLGHYEEGGDIAISNDGLNREMLLIGQPSTGKIRAFQSQPNETEGEADTIELVTTLKTFDGENIFTPGMSLATGTVFSGLTGYQCSNASGKLQTLPPGVDIFVSVNQWNKDAACSADSTQPCDTAYQLLDNFVLQGACQVDWSKIQTLDIVNP